jgi:ATP-binding cassette subfamily F protein 3
LVKPEKTKVAVAPKLNRKSVQSKLIKLEAELNKCQTELNKINQQLGDPATYAECSSDFIADLNTRREQLEIKVSELEESWLELEMSLEEAV